MIIKTDSVRLKSDRKTIVGVGFFDGFHVGHGKLLDHVLTEAKAKSSASIIYTYQSHPDKTIKGINTPLLMSMETRIEYLRRKGLDILCIDEFNDKYARITANEFIDNILLGRLNAGAVVAGFNYTFGDKGFGDAKYLTEYGKKAGFDVHIIPPVVINGETVSSTLIRNNVAAGNMEKVAKMLGRPYSVDGIVSTGHRIGREIGFPTANIIPDPTLVLLGNGVYMTATLISETLYRSITNVGLNPTVRNDGEVRYETHIIDFDKEIYKKRIKVFFVKKIREEMIFISQEHLAGQISRDVAFVDNEWRKAGGVRKWLQNI